MGGTMERNGNEGMMKGKAALGAAWCASGSFRGPTNKPGNNRVAGLVEELAHGHCRGCKIELAIGISLHSPHAELTMIVLRDQGNTRHDEASARLAITNETSNEAEELVFGVANSEATSVDRKSAGHDFDACGERRRS